jgi:hypothetical protein
MTLPDIEAAAQKLTPEQRDGLLPCSPHRATLPKQYLTWRVRIGRRYSDPKLNNAGYKLREIVHGF